MSVIAFTNQKGGCSKSTCAVHMAYWLTSKGSTVLVVDADAQRSSSIWLESFEDLEIPTSVVNTPDDLLEQVPQLAQQYDFVVVDGPAGLSEITRAILFRADLAIVPCQPSGLDLKSAADVIRTIQQAQSVRNGPPQAVLFLARAIRGTRLKDEALEVLNKTGFPVLKTVVHQRQVVADTFGQCGTVWQLPGRPASEARTEFNALFKEIMERLP